MQIKVATNYDDVLIDGPVFFFGGGGTKKNWFIRDFCLTQEQIIFTF